jgi:hypothetical protein
MKRSCQRHTQVSGRALAFNKLDHLRRGIFEWDRYHHMHMIRHQMAFLNPVFLLPSRRLEHRALSLSPPLSRHDVGRGRPEDRRLRRAGFMDRKADRFAWNADRRIWTVEILRGDGTREICEARHVISPALRDLMNAIRPKPISTGPARDLKYRDFLTVVLIGKSLKEFKDNWVYIHDPSVKVRHVQNFRSW